MYLGRIVEIGDVDAVALGPQGQVWIGSSYSRLSRFDINAALPASSISVIHRAAVAIGAVIVLSIALFALLLTTSIRPSMPRLTSRNEIGQFSIGFAGWFVVAMLLWVFLRASTPQVGFLFINPLALLAPLVNLLLLISFFARQRRMFSGALSALLVNWIALLLIGSGAEGVLSGSAVGTVFMVPFFMTLFV